MEILKRITVFTLVLIGCSLASHAITFEEFIAKCDTICKVTPIKLTGDQMPQLKEEKIEEMVVYTVDNISIDIQQKVIDAANAITKTEEMLVVKHNEDDTAVQVFILPNGVNMKILVTVFDDTDGVIVYLAGSAEILKHDNLVNIGGKDLIKEALKGQIQELNE